MFLNNNMSNFASEIISTSSDSEDNEIYDIKKVRVPVSEIIWGFNVNQKKQDNKVRLLMNDSNIDHVQLDADSDREDKHLMNILEN